MLDLISEVLSRESLRFSDSTSFPLAAVGCKQWHRFQWNWEISRKSLSGNSREAKPSGRVLFLPKNKSTKDK